MRTDPSSLVVAVVFLAVAALVVAVLVNAQAENCDVLHGGYIKRDDDKD
jgi:hypothetical protein